MSRGILVLVIAVAGILYLSLRSNLLDDDVPREKLSSIINSEFQEVRPLISPDGRTLYFSRRHHPGNTGGARDYQDIWVSHYRDGTWSEPETLDQPLNNKKTNTLCSITSDGRYALLLDSYKRVKTPLVQAFNSTAGWSEPMELIIEDFTNRSPYYDFFYQEQLEVIISGIDDGKGHGQQDLHVSFKQGDGSYTKPLNLGATINSKMNDFAPFMAADGRTLYFASFGHNGLGGSDFYVSYRLDDSWQRWTEPKNLGPGINSQQDENYLSVTADFKYVYFESYPTGAEEKDIYRAMLPRQFHPQHLVPQEPSATTEIIATSDQGAQPEPRAKAAMGPDNTVKGEGKAIPDIPELFTGNLATHQYFQDGQLKAKLLRNSYFPYDSYQLPVENRSKLDEIAGILQNNPSLQVHLEGHADSWGADEINLRISYLRAQAAAHYLVDQGISANRLLVTAAGEDDPLASNDDETEGREFNRRVEIRLVDPQPTITDLE